MPEITKKIVDQEGPIGGNASFTVEFDSKPPATVKWMKNGIELSQGGRYQITQEEYKATFTIRNLWETDNNSQIYCVVSNPLGKQMCDAWLRIKAPPRVEREPGDQVAELDETVKVKIPISGKGPFDLKLTKDDLPIDAGKVKVNEVDGTITITIPSRIKIIKNKF